MQNRSAHTPGLLRRPIAARQRKGTEMPQPLKINTIRQQQFTTPSRPVRTQADAVQGQAQDGPREAVFGSHRGHMGVMMLHTETRYSPLRREDLGIAAGMEIRVQIADHGCGLTPQQVLQMVHGIFERDAGRAVVQIAIVLGKHRPVVAGEAYVFLRPAPTASTEGPPAGRRTGSGT